MLMPAHAMLSAELSQAEGGREDGWYVPAGLLSATLQYHLQITHRKDAQALSHTSSLMRDTQGHTVLSPAGVRNRHSGEPID